MYNDGSTIVVCLHAHGFHNGPDKLSPRNLPTIYILLRNNTSPLWSKQTIPNSDNNSSGKVNDSQLGKPQLTLISKRPTLVSVAKKRQLTKTVLIFKLCHPPPTLEEACWAQEWGMDVSHIHFNINYTVYRSIHYIDFCKIPALELLRHFWVGMACCCLAAILANRKQCCLHGRVQHIRKHCA